MRTAILIVGVAISLASATVGCKRNPAVTGETPAPLTLSGYTIQHVRLPYVHEVPGEKGERKSFTEAWLVVLSLRNLGPPRALATDFYIGEYRIPEYGGVGDGIYFRIYDETKLRSLDGQEIFVQGQDGMKRKMGQKFRVPDLQSLPLEEEEAVLKRRNK